MGRDPEAPESLSCAILAAFRLGGFVLSLVNPVLVCPDDEGDFAE